MCLSNKKYKNGKVYIGSTTDLDKRIKLHKDQLKGNWHHNYKLQKAYNDGELFEIEILELVPNKDELIQKEQSYFDLYKPYLDENGYNILRYANGLDYMNKKYRMNNTPEIFEPAELSLLKGKTKIVYNFLMKYKENCKENNVTLMYNDDTVLTREHIKIDGIKDIGKRLKELASKGYIIIVMHQEGERYLYNPLVS